MRRLVLGIALPIMLVLAGTAGAALFSSSPSPGPAHTRDADEARETEAVDDAGVHGGPIDRFHGSGACNLTAVGALPGNWTHGDYVDAVATSTGDSTLIMQAARSDCGKPMVAVDRGGGPPAHALGNEARGERVRAGAPAEAPTGR